MRASDFAAPVAAVAFPVDQTKMLENASLSGSSVDWQRTSIIELPRNNRLVVGMDHLADARAAYRKRMHDALDALLDGDADRLLRDAAEENPDPEEKAHIPLADDDEEPEEESEDEEEEDQDAVVITAKDRSTAMDCAPGKTCCFDCGNLDGVAAVNRQRRNHHRVV